ncbi:MAG TPA: alpha-2-macroglobulin family protein [Pyrinomonadaceae bacterium]|nr:alpha-2-macroglobulin family protein [Pyrinomonadaceae bacterium]
MLRLHVALSLFLVVCLVFGSLITPRVIALNLNHEINDAQKDNANDVDAVQDTNSTGLQFRVSESAGQPESRETKSLPTTTPLSKMQIANILRRLAPLKTDTHDQQPFAFRERSLPPPLTGKTINVSFPATENVAAPETSVGELRVLRYSPKGDVPLAPSLSVTFSQAMISVSSQEEAAANVPVKLSPEIPGKWRWIGTNTILFEPHVRFPMSTRYTATVPAGTRSQNGGQTASEVVWTFTTPPPIIKQKYPEENSQSEPRDKLMFIEFDQRINPAVVLKNIKVRAEGAEISTRLATKEEIEADSAVKDRVENAEKDRWLAFRAVDQAGATKLALPLDANITVSVGSGTPSLEGPLRTEKAQEFSFRTYGPLKLIKSECGYDNNCTPNDMFRLTFNNSLRFDSSKFRIEPSTPRTETSSYANFIGIGGIKQPDTTYRVTIDKSLTDIFDQQFGKDETVTFNVGPMFPRMVLSANGFTVLDPAAPRQISLYSLNLKTVRVSLYKPQPEDWFQFKNYVQTRAQNQNTKVVMPGQLIYSRQLDLQTPGNQIAETVIDLTSAFTDKFGQAIVMVEGVDPAIDAQHNPLVAWVQSTRIGLDAFADNDQLIGWANSLEDGSPLADVQLEALPARLSAITGSNGLARIDLKTSNISTASLLVARRGNEVAILPEHPDIWTVGGTWEHHTRPDDLRWYVFDDRKLYRPGEEVHFKGWIRRVGTGSNGDIGPLEGVVKKLSYRVEDESDNELIKGEVTVNALGGFDAAFKLPANMSLGQCEIEFTTETDVKGFKDREYRHTFSVQEFRRPEYEVNTRNETEGPIFVGGGVDLSVAAKYFAGGGLTDAQVKWTISSMQTSFTPPNRDDYTFGRWVRWWTSDAYYGEHNFKEISGRTDATGQHRIRIDFDSVRPALPSTVFVQASVEDVNRQSWSSSTTLLVHPAKLYVGLKSERTFIQKGEPLVVQAIVTDLDGQAIADREIKIRTVSQRWRQINGTWLQVEDDPQDCSVKSSTSAVPCTFAASEGGVYNVTATIKDDRGRPNETQMTFWVAGGDMPTRRDLAQDKVELIPDRRVYHPGETAQVLVQTPFYPADGVMTLRRSGIVRTEHFHIDGPTYTLRLPIEEGWLPNIHVQVDLVGAVPRATDTTIGATPEPKAVATTALPTKRPAFASGNISLSIPPLSRTLKVTATPLKTTLAPGGLANVTVKVQDAAGKPIAGSEIALVAVDESVLSLTNYQLENPIQAFYRLREMETTDHHLRSSLKLATAAELARGDVIVGRQIQELPLNGRSLNNLLALQPGAAMETVDVTSSSTGSTTQITMRKNFNALAVFAPTLRTNAAGIAQAQFKLPDNLTRYRVMAVAVSGGKQFGSGESAITARKPLMVRPSAPRFLNFGDRFELPIIVQNQTDLPLTVDVAARATNAFLSAPGAVATASVSNKMGRSLPSRSLPLPVQTGLRVTVPANDRVEVRIPAVTAKPGTARFQIAGVSGGWSDASEIELPVWTPATTEAFATYGEVDEGTITQAVKAPAGVFKQFGGLEVQTSSTQLQQLTDAFLYLQHYPFECSEQLASRIISVAALRDVLTAFKSQDLPSPQEIEDSVLDDLKKLQGMQNDDGGFGFWRKGDESWPYLSIHVAHALARAKQKNFAVPNEMFEESQRYLQSIETHIPQFYSENTRRAIIAYALYVRAQMDDSDPERARKLIAEAGLDKLSLESVGWLLSVLSSDNESTAEVAAMRRLLGNRVSETAGTAHFVCSYDDGDYLILNSSRRADGIILEALIGDQPQNDLIPKLVRGLLAHRSKGRWENTQENVFILLALDRYFNTFEKVTPNFVTRVWLGDAYAGEQQFKGRSTDRQELKIPMNYLANKGTTQNLVMSKTGAGRLYYRIGMNYAPEDLNLKAADYGFIVERTYEAIDKPDDVKRDADGTWHIKAGARVRVRLTMIAPGRRYHVALVDPMPAGLESLNPVLVTTEVVPEDERPTGVGEYGSRSIGYGWWRWRSVWFDHQNLRDERAEAFTALLWEGAYNYSYVARATTPGVFVVPPAKAEEMYHPETFGRGKTDRVVIE